MKKTGKLMLLLLGASLGAGCASDGISTGGPIAPGRAPVVKQIKKARDDTKILAANVLEDVVAVPIQFFFGTDPGFSPNEPDVDTLTPDERLARRRHAMNMPDAAETRIAKRRAAWRRKLELTHLQ